MALQTIETRLNQYFTENKNRIVIWYDPEKQYESSIGQLLLVNATLIIVTDKNTLQTKYRLDKEEPESKFLLYTTFSEQELQHTALADVTFYAFPFSVDVVSTVCHDLEIEDKYKYLLQKYPEFWKVSAYEEQFKKLLPKEQTEDTIAITLLAVAVDAENAEFQEVVSIVFYDRAKDIVQKLASLKLDELFWKCCEEEFGYYGNKTVDALRASLLFTHAASYIKSAIPENYKFYITKNSSHAKVFVSHLMHDDRNNTLFNQISKNISKKFHMIDFVAKLVPEEYSEADTFVEFDSAIISYFVKQMVSASATLSTQYRAILANRIKKTHFAEEYSNEYHVIDRADHVLSAIVTFEHDILSVTCADDIIQKYVDSWNKIDRYYRQFYTVYDACADLEPFTKLREIIEDRYTNKYLLKLSQVWSEKLSAVSDYSKLYGKKQWEFYEKVAAPSAEQECTVVIISDAFRYECARELGARFIQKVGNEVNFGYMISTLPSYTQLGMAALLPHKELSYTSDFSLLIDGCLCNDNSKRQSILQNANPNTAVCLLDDLKTREAIRKVFAGKKLVYIYHNQIDARAEKMQSENETFDACQSAIDEIEKLINKLISDRSIGKFYIVADHGFIYKRDKLISSDKIETVGRIPLDADKDNRFILTRNPMKIDGTIQYSLAYLDPSMKDITVSTPRGVEVLKMAGGGQNYVHGGISPQEIIVPLLCIEPERKQESVETVTVELKPCANRITNINTYLDFIQKENVDESHEMAKIDAWFEDEEGNKITDVDRIVADRKNAQPEDRVYHEKFTFASKKYPKEKKYYLVMEQKGTDDTMLYHKTIEFMIDMVFVDDFGF
jgi:uncharacterized protein (TIGR02687 family)